MYLPEKFLLSKTAQLSHSTLIKGMKNEFTGCAVWDHNYHLRSCNWDCTHVDYQLLYGQKSSAKAFEL